MRGARSAVTVVVMNFTTTALAAAATLGIAAAVLPTTSPATAGPATSATTPAATTETTVLTYRLGRDAEFKTIDIGRKGETVGDHNLAAVTLRAHGEVAGRLQNDCVVLDRAYEGHLCTLVLIIDGGQVTLASGGVGKRIPHVGGRGDVFAVTGGSGDYQGAGGQLTIGDDGRQVVLTLVP